MPQNTTISVESAWELLTDANVTEITFQNIGTGAIYVNGTVGDTTPPNAAEFGVLYRPGEGEAGKTLADLFPGVSGVNRLWAKSASTDARVFVSHA